MQANTRRDTSTEIAMRRALHRDGLRFRVDLPIRLPGRRAMRPDVVFTRRRVALFIDGCFWHCCPLHGTLPATNADYWLPKLEENRRRDARNTAELEEAGWAVLRVWAHDPPEYVARRVRRLLAERGGPVPES